MGEVVRTVHGRNWQFSVRRPGINHDVTVVDCVRSAAASVVYDSTCFDDRLFADVLHVAK